MGGQNNTNLSIIDSREGEVLLGSIKRSGEYPGCELGPRTFYF
jgi:hypothetical protein